MERRAYVKKAFQMYQTNKTTLFWKEQEYKNIPVPGEGALNYDKIAVQSSGNGVEAQFVKYAEERAKLQVEIEALKKKIELVSRTIKYFEIESRAKGKRHYEYIRQRWLMGRSYRRAAIECGIAERTADFWIEEIFTVALAIGETYELF